MDDTLKFNRITILTIALSAARVKLGHFMHHDRDFYALFCYFKISSFSEAIVIMDAVHLMDVCCVLILYLDVMMSLPPQSLHTFIVASS